MDDCPSRVTAAKTGCALNSKFSSAYLERKVFDAVDRRQTRKCGLPDRLRKHAKNAWIRRQRKCRSVRRTDEESRLTAPFRMEC